MRFTVPEAKVSTTFSSALGECRYTRYLATSGGRSDAVEDRRISHHNIVLIHPVNDLLIEVRWNAEDRGYSREIGGLYSNTLSIEWKEGAVVLDNKQQSKV